VCLKPTPPMLLHTQLLDATATFANSHEK